MDPKRFGFGSDLKGDTDDRENLDVVVEPRMGGALQQYNIVKYVRTVSAM